MSLCPDLASGRVTLGAWLRQAAALGLDGADVSVAHVDRRPAAFDSLRQEAADAGIERDVPAPASAAFADRVWVEAGGRSRRAPQAS